MKKNIENRKIKQWLFGIILVFLIATFSFIFIKQYHELGDTLEEERITYVSELKKLLVQNINTEKEQQSELADIYARALLTTHPRDFVSVKTLLGDLENKFKDEGDKIFLMDEKGQIYDLDGKQSFFSDMELGRALVVGKEAVFSYAEVKSGERYWICGQPISGLKVNDMNICAVLNARAIENFTRRLTINMFNNSGLSYIAEKDGSIVIAPPSSDNIGYNLFYSLENLGADPEVINTIMQDFSNGIEGQQILTFEDNRWLINYSSSTYEKWVVVILMPMTITAANTYTMMHNTLVSVMALLASILLFFLFVIFLLYQYERKRDKLLHEEKLQLETSKRVAESKTEFLAKMSHDIRTPLNAVIGLIQIMIDQNKGQPAVVGNLKKANTSANYLLGILNDILDMSKIESGKMILNPTPVNIQSILNGILSLNEIQLQEKELDFQICTEGKLRPAYMLDRLRLNQILMNLLSNSIKFTPKGGKITLIVEKINIDYAWDRLTFIMKDTGIGMSEEFCSNLFQPFVQENPAVSANYGGSGLGLSIVKNLVEMMDGEIMVNSKLGEGTQFTITLLVKIADTQEVIKTEKEGEIDLSLLKGKTILLAEDIEINAEIAKEILQGSFGVYVDIAENGKIAVEKFKESKPGTYSVIFMDIQMPVMNGLKAAAAIRSCGHPEAETIPILAMSANAFDDDVEKSLKHGMNAHLSKPIDINAIKQALNKYLI